MRLKTDKIRNWTPFKEIKTDKKHFTRKNCFFFNISKWLIRYGLSWVFCVSKLSTTDIVNNNFNSNDKNRFYSFLDNFEYIFYQCNFKQNNNTSEKEKLICFLSSRNKTCTRMFTCFGLCFAQIESKTFDAELMSNTRNFMEFPSISKNQTLLILSFLILFRITFICWIDKRNNFQYRTPGWKKNF